MFSKVFNVLYQHTLSKLMKACDETETGQGEAFKAGFLFHPSPSISLAYSYGKLRAAFSSSQHIALPHGPLKCWLKTKNKTMFCAVALFTMMHVTLYKLVFQVFIFFCLDNSTTEKASPPALGTLVFKPRSTCLHSQQNTKLLSGFHKLILCIRIFD